MLAWKWGPHMKEWGFWDWLAYARLWISGSVIFADASLKQSSSSLREPFAAILESRTWGLLPIVCIVAGTLILLGRKFGWLGSKVSDDHQPSLNFQKWPEPYRPVVVTGKRFRNERVPLDGFSYTGCDFVNVTFVYNGTTPIQLSNNRISGFWVGSDNVAISGTWMLAAGLGLIRQDILLNMPPGNIIQRPNLINQPGASLPSPTPPAGTPAKP